MFVASAASAQIAGERAVSTPVYAPVAGVFGPAIASDGDGFLAVWSDQRDRAAIYASRIARDGTVLDPLGIFLANAASGFAVAWTGDKYLVVWNESNNITALQLAADGRVVAPAHVILRKAQVIGRRPLAANGKIAVLITNSGYVVLDRDANVAGINSDGFPGEAAYVTGSGEFILTAGGGTMRLDSSGRFATRTNRGWPGIIACRTGECTTAFANTHRHLAVASYDPAALVVGPAIELPIDQAAFDLATTADGYILVTRTNTLQRLGPDGHPLGPPTVLPGATASEVTIASNGRDVAVLGTSSTSLTSVIVTRNAVTQPATVAFSANAQHDVAIARSDSNYLAVWTEKDGTYAGRLSLDGTPLDGRGTLLGSAIGKPSVIFDGTSYLVVLRNDPPLYAYAYNRPQSTVQVDRATGAVMWVFRIAAGSLRVASNGVSRIAVWTEETRLVAAFLSPNGTVASVPVFVAAPPPGTVLANLSVAWNGTIWFLAWEEGQQTLGIVFPYVPSYIPFAIRGARLSAALIPIDTQPITITEKEYILSSRVVSDGRDFLLAWSGQLLGELQPSVRVRRAMATGSLADTETLLFRGRVQDLIWDGTQYNLAFSTYTSYLTAPADLAVAHLRPSGQAFETFVISATPDDERNASLVSLGNGRVVAAYTRVAHEPLYGGVERAFIAAPRPARGRAVRKEMQ